MRRSVLFAVPLFVALALVAGCESTSPSKSAAPQVPAAPPPPPPLQEAPAAQRAQLHMEIAAGFYERGQMDIALQELGEAVKLDPANAKIYNVYGLVHAVLGQDAEAQQNFQKALSLAPNDSEIRQNWGWYLCTHGRAKESLAEFDIAVRNPLYKTPDVSLVNAGKCAIAVGETRRGDEYLRRALAINPANVYAAYNLALLKYREAQLQDARALMRRVLQQPAPPPEALYLGMCIERKLGDAPAETSYVSQLRNRYPESAEAKAIPPGTCE
ncbi:MAG: type IV pilus biogenesis/stability protein PilW [Burkholderiales bacterium]